MGLDMTETEKGWGHTTVLLQEAIDGLEIKPGEIFVDATLGSGGHTEEVLKRYGNLVQIIAIDADKAALGRSDSRLGSLIKKAKANIAFIQSNFRDLDQVLNGLKLVGVDKILFDLGLSSNQLEESGRGFSFQKDEPLQMTFKEDPTDTDVTAYTVVNDWSEETLATILWGFGGERYARRIASQIVQARARAHIKTTHELVSIILEATPQAYHHRRIHPATKTFQALRIAVNDELTTLKSTLERSFVRLKPGGRIAIISFHSLEDRIVKNFFKEKAKEKLASLITKKPIVPTSAELAANRRARSAKLRILLKT